MAKSDNDTEMEFMESLQGVRRLKFDRVDLHRQRPKPKPRARPQSSPSTPAQSPNKSPWSDTAVSDSYFRHGLSKKLQRGIRQGKYDIDAVLDLHGYRQHQAIRELDSFLQQALAAHMTMLLVIHGKGYRSQSDAVLRPLVQNWLMQQPMVMAYCHAQPRDGGNGASYVYLKSGG